MISYSICLSLSYLFHLEECLQGPFMLLQKVGFPPFYDWIIFDVKSWLIWKDPDPGKDWGQEKGTTEDEMVGWHHQLDGHGFGWTLGVDDGQGGLASCSPWGCKESDTTERLNWTELNIPSCICLIFFYPFICCWTLGIFRDLAFVNHTSKNTGLPIYLWDSDFISFRYVTKSGIAGSFSSCF